MNGFIFLGYLILSVLIILMLYRDYKFVKKVKEVKNSLCNITINDHGRIIEKENKV